MTFWNWALYLFSEMLLEMQLLRVSNVNVNVIGKKCIFELKTLSITAKAQWKLVNTLTKSNYQHCEESVRIRSFSGLFFRIQSEC